MTFDELAQQAGAKRVAATEALPSFDELKKLAGAKPAALPRSLYRANTLADGEEAVRGMNTLERFGAGVGAGFDNVGKNVADLTSRIPGIESILPGAKSLRPDPAAWEEERRNTAALSDTTPGFIGKMAGETAALLPATMALGAASTAALPAAAAASAPWLARMLPKAARLGWNAAEGFGQGYLMGGPEARNESGGVGAFINAVGGPLLGKALRATYQGVVKPTAAALKLMKEGVTDLTLGQMAPRSMLAQFEEAGTSSGAGGDILRAQRQRPVEQWKDVVLSKAAPPGMSAAPQGTTAEKLASTYGGFENAYSPIKDAPLPADMGGVTMRDAMSEAFRSAADDPLVLADEAKRGAVNKFLQTQATVLDKVPVTPWPSSPLLAEGQALPRALGLPANAGPSSSALVPTQANPLATSGGLIIPPKPVIPGMRGSIPAASVMKVREGIRKKAAQKLAGGSPDYDTAELLGNAENTLTEALDTHLPKGAAKKLRAVDAQYRKYKVVEDAVRRAGDAPDGFRPTHLEAAVKASEEGGKYARGGGGVLRDLSSAGREVFDTRVPMTGARYLTAGPMSWVTSPLAALANTSIPKGLITGTTRPQQWAQGVESAIESRAPALAHALRMATTRAASPKEKFRPTEKDEQLRRQAMMAEALQALKSLGR